MNAVADVTKPMLPSADQEYNVELDIKNGRKYIYCQAYCIIPLIAHCAILPCLPCFNCWLYKEFASQKAKITNRQLVYQGGWLNRVSKSIPLDAIQDISIEESCLQRCFSIKSVKIQTAGSSRPNGAAEATILAPLNAEMVRDIIMQRRESLLYGISGGIAVRAGSGARVGDRAVDSMANRVVPINIRQG